MFCSGHAFLPDGKLLIAGGTKRYEVLPQDVKRAAGVMTIMNESPKGADHLAKGTTFVGPTGIRFRTTDDVVLPAADKAIDALGHVSVQASSTEVWSSRSFRPLVGDHGTPPVQGRRLEGGTRPQRLRHRRSSDPQHPDWGDDKSYIFDPVTERYRRSAT